MSPGAPASDRISNFSRSSLNRHRPRPPLALALLLLPFLCLVLLLYEPSSTMTAAAFLLAPSRGRVLFIGLQHHPAAATATSSLLRHYHPHQHPTRHRGLSLPQVARAAAAASTLPDAHPPRPRNETASSGVVEGRPAPPTLLVVEEETEAVEVVAAAAAAEAGLDESEAAEDEEGIDALLGA